MAIEHDLKIFISWSGDLAKEVMKVLHLWLPKMFDHIDPWASDVDIQVGQRSFDEIQDRLNASSFGLIIVTPENMEKPWLNFEAGALSKRLDGDANRVVPLMVNFDDPYQLQGPIKQFHGTLLNQDGMLKVCKSIARVIGLDSPTIETRFEWAWPALEEAIKRAKEMVANQPAAPPVEDKDLLKSLLSSVGALSRQVSNLESAATSLRPAGGALSDQAKRRLHRYGLESDPWSDGAVMQAYQDQIENIASAFKPVRYVSPVERDGRRYIAIRFADGKDLNQADSNWLMEQLLPLPVAVQVETDRD